MKNSNKFECPEGAGGGVGEPGFPATMNIFCKLFHFLGSFPSIITIYTCDKHCHRFICSLYLLQIEGTFF